MTNLKNEKGQSAIMLAMLTITFLLLTGFSLDTGNLLLEKSHLQRALDAGVIAGITRYASGDASGTIASTAQEMALYNLREMGLANKVDNVTATFTVDKDQVATLSLTGKVNTNTLFMYLIPGGGLATVTTAGSSTGVRNPAIISLVLDVSGSMSASMTALKNAANAFVDTFEEGLDQIALISFSDKALVLVPMQIVNKTTLHNQINGLASGGFTGSSEALVLGRKELEKITNPIAVRAMLLFTDGAPNVVRPIFTNGKTPPLTKNYPSTAPVNYDYVARLNQTPPDLLNPNTMNSTCMRNGNCPVTCTNIANCLNSFAYNDSRGNPGHFSHITSLISPYTQMRKESYDLAIIESDYAKTDKITIYTVGLGTEAAKTSDPYQNVDDTGSLKPVFLRRIANDPASASDPAFPGLPTNNSHPIGTYLQTPNTSNLTSLFQTIAQKIKLRLI